MTTTLGRFSENPQDITQELIEQEQLLEEKKQVVRWKTWEDITQEEFNNMSWDDVKKYIRLDDNKITLFQKPISYWLTHVFWSSDKLDWLEDFRKEKTILERFKKQFEQKELLINILQIWIPEAQKQSQVWFKWARKDDDIIESHIGRINNLINNFWVPVEDEDFYKQAENIFYLMEVSEDQESIIWDDDLDKLKWIFFDEQLSLEEKQIKIFNLMRYWGWSWNSEWVKDVIAYKLLETEKFKIEKEILENPKIREYLDDNNIEGLNELIWEELTQDLIKIYEKTKIKIDKWLRYSIEEKNKEIRRKNKKIRGKMGKNEELDEWEKLKEEIILSEYLIENKDKIVDEIINATLWVFKHILIRNKLEEEKDRWNENTSLNWIYANITWLWEIKYWDYITIWDDNIDLAIDFASTIAMWAITMWAWIGAIALTRGLVMSARVANIWNKVAKWLQVAEYLQKWTKIWEISRFVWSSVLEWVSFYEWATLIQNIVFRDLQSGWDIIEWTWNTSELIKNIAFMWALNSLRFLSKIPWMWRIMNFDSKIPNEYLKPGNIKTVLEKSLNILVPWIRDWTMMYWISLGIDFASLEWWHPTVREYLEFITLIQLFHLKDIWKK